MTALQQLIHWTKNSAKDVSEGMSIMDKMNELLELEKQQLGNCWDEAIKAHDERGHVHARSICDFDDYYNELTKSK
jgi:hypothetical protein